VIFLILAINLKFLSFHAMKESFGDGMISNWSVIPVLIGAHIATRYPPDVFNKACRRWSYLSIIAIIVLLVLDPGLFVAFYFTTT